jgi:hypothetical protein
MTPAAALAAAFGLLSVVGERGALAQPGCEVTEMNHFDSANGEILIEIRPCATGQFSEWAEGGNRVITDIPDVDFSPGDPQRSHLRVHSRGIEPCRLPGGSDLPGARFEATFTSRTAANTLIMITLSPVTEKPTLKTTSTPPKGTKVKPGDTIKIRMEASEEYNHPRLGWQTGVKKIQLRAQRVASGAARVIPARERLQAARLHRHGQAGGRRCQLAKRVHW